MESTTKLSQMDMILLKGHLDLVADSKTLDVDCTFKDTAKGYRSIAACSNDDCKVDQHYSLKHRCK